MISDNKAAPITSMDTGITSNKEQDKISPPKAGLW